MTFRDPELQRLAEGVLNAPRSPQQTQLPPPDPKTALARVLRRQRRMALRLVTR